MTARALAPLAVVAEYAAPLLRWAGRSSPGGAGATEDEARGAPGRRASSASSGPEIRAVQPYPGARTATCT